MDVGVISEDFTTFDIAQYEELNSVLSRLDNGAVVRTRFLYKDEQNRAVSLHKEEPKQMVFPRGTRLSISAVSGVAQCDHPHKTNSTTSVGRLAVDLDFAQPDPQLETITLEDGTKLYRVPVILTTK